ncbi:MAG: phosphotransferase [Alphaproteobacteria bacterium]|nr:phosphotransferase [Alphaproteobacteria bacterium]
MKRYKLEDCIYTIKDMYSDGVKIKMPKITGTQNNVFFVNTGDDREVVFKFSAPQMVMKNAAVSSLYYKHGIPAPIISANKHKGLSFEKYDVLPGCTFFEAIKDGMTEAQIKQVYREILVEFAKMAQIRPNMLAQDLLKDINNVVYMHVSNVHNPAMGALFAAVAYLLNVGRDENNAVFHSDITPKNTIVSPDGHLVGFVDIDSASVCNKRYAFGALAAKYQELGFDMTELFDFYENDTTDVRKLNRDRIKAMANITNFGKRLMWKCSQHKAKRSK